MYKEIFLISLFLSPPFDSLLYTGYHETKLITYYCHIRQLYFLEE